MAWLSLLLKGKKVAGAIKGVKPFSKTGAKSVEHWKSRMDMKKVINKASGVTEGLQTTAKNLKKLTETLKKQKDIIDK